jgi:Mitochondrial genome maintenance MGM101
MAKRKSTTKVRARGARPKPARSTALVLARRRTPSRPPVVLPPAPTLTLTDDLALGMLGLVEPKFTPHEEAVLAEAVDRNQVLIKPTGQPYLSHPYYTRWLNRALGRAAWALVPASKPQKAQNDKTDTITVVQPFVLFIHRQPVAFANGEHEYQPKNREQTYGDALESTVASALRRCCKRLGIGLELWDRRWLNAWIREFAICVKVNAAKKGQPEDIKRQWRLKADRPFWNEVGGDRRSGTPSPTPPVATHAAQDDVITHGDRDRPGQLERLWTIIRSSGRTESELREWLKARYGIESTSQIKRRDYDAIVKAIEHPGPLSTREPGEEG